MLNTLSVLNEEQPMSPETTETSTTMVSAVSHDSLVDIPRSDSDVRQRNRQRAQNWKHTCRETFLILPSRIHHDPIILRPTLCAMTREVCRGPKRLCVGVTVHCCLCDTGTRVVDSSHFLCFVMIWTSYSLSPLVLTHSFFVGSEGEA